MAQRDYVKKKSKAKNTSRIIPNLMMAIAVILVILFVAILYFVSTNKTNKPSAPVDVITEKPQITLPDKQEERWTYLKELENPGGANNSTQLQSNQASQDKERQKILDNFINDKAQVSTTTPAVADKSTTTTSTNTNQTKVDQSKPAVDVKSNQTGSWILQCGAFKDRANAESLQAKLAMIGVTSFVKNEKFYRVLAGPYDSKGEAEKVVTTLKSNNMTSCIITSK